MIVYNVLIFMRTSYHGAGCLDRRRFSCFRLCNQALLYVTIRCYKCQNGVGGDLWVVGVWGGWGEERGGTTMFFCVIDGV